MFEMSFVVALGLLVMLAKLPWRGKLWVVSHPLMMDLAVFISLMMLHWGTFSGVMIATIAAFLCSLTLSLARRVIGHVGAGGTYVRGFFDVSGRLQ